MEYQEVCTAGTRYKHGGVNQMRCGEISGHLGPCRHQEWGFGGPPPSSRLCPSASLRGSDPVPFFVLDRRRTICDIVWQLPLGFMLASRVKIKRLLPVKWLNVLSWLVFKKIIIAVPFPFTGPSLPFPLYFSLFKCNPGFFKEEEEATEVVWIILRLLLYHSGF